MKRVSSVCRLNIRAPFLRTRQVPHRVLTSAGRPVRRMADAELAALLQLEEQQQGAVVEAINRDMQKAFSVRLLVPLHAACARMARAACMHACVPVCRRAGVQD